MVLLIISLRSIKAQNIAIWNSRCGLNLICLDLHIGFNQINRNISHFNKYDWYCKWNGWPVCLISGYIPTAFPWGVPMEKSSYFCYCCEFLRLWFCVHFTLMNWCVRLKHFMMLAALFPVHFTAFLAAMAGDLLWRANYEKWQAVQVLFTF